MFMFVVIFVCLQFLIYLFFFFNDTASTEIYTLSLHDALPIPVWMAPATVQSAVEPTAKAVWLTRRNHERSEEHTSESSHSQISYAVFCLKKKKKKYRRLVNNKKKKIKTINTSFYNGY